MDRYPWESEPRLQPFDEGKFGMACRVEHRLQPTVGQHRDAELARAGVLVGQGSPSGKRPLHQSLQFAGVAVSAKKGIECICKMKLIAH
jgi:hypothetical protein